MKKLSRNFCKEQLLRLEVVPLWMPSTEASVEEWLRAMQQECQTEEHAERCITTLIRYTTSSTNPLGDFIAIAQGSRSAEVAPPGCDVCGGSEYGDYVERTDGTWGRCGCERGRWMLRKDRERSAREKAEKDAPRSPRFTPASDVVKDLLN